MQEEDRRARRRVHDVREAGVSRSSPCLVARAGKRSDAAGVYAARQGVCPMTGWMERFARKLRLLDSIDARVRRMQEALGRMESRQLVQMNLPDPRQNEFQVYSQWGEDGIIQWLLRNVRVSNKVFLEFGVEDYSESNTRFLLVNDHWSGLVIDSSVSHIEALRHDPIYWRHNLKSLSAFVTRENIDELIVNQGLERRVGLLSIDVDGNDYWIWRDINAIDPELVIVEYNARFGPNRAVSIPYEPGFQRSLAHHSRIYYGASLAALTLLGQRKGYALVACNSAGNNAFFVKRELLSPVVVELSPDQAFVPAGFRESRDEQGRLAFLSSTEEQRILQRMPVVEVDGT